MAMGNYAAGMANMSAWLADRLIRHRVALLVVFTALTVFLGYHAAQLRMDPGFDKSIPLEHPYMQTYVDYRDSFGGANVLIVALMQKEGDIFNVEFFRTLEQATRDVLFINGVNRPSVTSLFTPNVDFIAVDEEGFVGHRVVPPDFSADEENIAKVRSNLLQSQHLGRLVSHDFRGALIRAELVETDPDTGEPLDYGAVADALEEIRARHSSERLDVHIIGFAKFIDDVIEGALGVVLFFAIAVVITAVMLYFYSSSLQITVLAMLVAIVAVVWQLGLVELLGYGIDPLSILVPFLILAIGVSHAIQMTNTWKLEVLGGASSTEAARTSFNKLFIPGTTALLANAVGFAVIMVIDIAIIHELGITASIGVAVMIITNKFLLPVLLSYARMRATTVERLRGRALAENKPFWRLLSNFARKGWALPAIVVWAVIGVFGFWVGGNLIVGDSEAGAPEFWSDSTYNRDIDAIISNFNVGIDELTVIVTMDQDGCVNFPIMDTVDRFAWEMRNVEGVQAVTSLSTIVRERTVGNNEGNLRFYELPRNPYAIGAGMRNIELNQKLFSDTCDALPVRLLLADHRAETLERVVQAVSAFEEQYGREDVSFHLASGSAGVMAAT